MTMVINTNVASMASQRHLAASRLDMEQAMERLSSGKRINSAMDDAAGLTIAHSLDSKIAGLNQAIRNTNDGIALVNVAEGALEEVSSILTRMKELSTQAINGTYTATDRDAMDLELQALTSEITRISEQTKFNGVSVLNSTTALTFQIGDTSSDTISVTPQRMGAAYLGITNLGETTYAMTDNGDDTHTTAVIAAAITATDQIRIRVGDHTFVQSGATGADEAAIHDAALDALAAQINAVFGAGTATVSADSESTAGSIDGDATLTIDADVDADGTANFSVSGLDVYARSSAGNISSMDLQNATNAGIALTVIGEAIADVDGYRSTLGAVANRMEHASSNLMSRVEHQAAARSRIQDADYAVESANLAKAQVLQQAGTAMLSQANASTQNVLSLLK